MNTHEKIKLLIKKQGLTYKELAKKVNMSDVGLRQTLLKNTVKMETLIKICDILNVTTDELLVRDYDNVEEALEDFKKNEKLLKNPDVKALLEEVHQNHTIDLIHKANEIHELELEIRELKLEIRELKVENAELRAATK